MPKPTDLLDAAQGLATVDRGRPRQANLLRAMSTVYYALFHALARTCADCLIGTGQRRSRAWAQVYRAVEHSAVKEACKHDTMLRFPDAVQNFADLFVEMQIARHRADYDPRTNVSRVQVGRGIELARRVIDDFNDVALPDRRAFAAYVLLRRRADETFDPPRERMQRRMRGRRR